VCGSTRARGVEGRSGNGSFRHIYIYIYIYISRLRWLKPSAWACLSSLRTWGTKDLGVQLREPGKNKRTRPALSVFVLNRGGPVASPAPPALSALVAVPSVTAPESAFGWRLLETGRSWGLCIRPFPTSRDLCWAGGGPWRKPRGGHSRGELRAEAAHRSVAWKREDASNTTGKRSAR
jgi:hypothetical protein